MEFSARRLKTFLECPRKFQFTYIDQIPVPTPSPLAFGKTIHEVIESIHLDGLWEESKALSLFRSLWEKRQREEPILFTDQTPEKYEKLAEKIPFRLHPKAKGTAATFAGGVRVSQSLSGKSSCTASSTK
jgi:hypothetical protein